jgi:hypothetical protein
MLQKKWSEIGKNAETRMIIPETRRKSAFEANLL